MGWIIILLLCLPFANPKLFLAIVLAILCVYAIFNLLSLNIIPTLLGLIAVIILSGLTSNPY